MRAFIILMCFPLFMFSQTKEGDSTIYFSVHFFNSIPQNGILNEPSIHDLGVGYSIEIGYMMYEDKLGLSINFLNQINPIDNVYNTSYGPEVPIVEPMMDRSAKLYNISLLFGLNYNFKIARGLIIQPYVLGGLNLGGISGQRLITYSENPYEPPKNLSGSDLSLGEAFLVGFKGQIPINDLMDFSLGASHFLSILNLQQAYLSDKTNIAVHNLNLNFGITIKL